MTVSHLLDDVAAILGSDRRIKIVSGNDALHQQLHQADAMMAASGTVTLQTALAGVPGVACYRTSALSALIGRRLVRMDRVILPNTLLQREVYPFLFQQAATPAALAAHIENIFSGAGDLSAQPDAHEVARRNASELRALLRGGKDDFETLVATALVPHFELRC